MLGDFNAVFGHECCNAADGVTIGEKHSQALADAKRKVLTQDMDVAGASEFKVCGDASQLVGIGLNRKAEGAVIGRNPQIYQ